MKKLLKVFGGFVGIAFTAAIIWVFLNPQPTIDWFRLRNYQPPVEISQLATDASFNEEGRRLFYVHYPELLEKSDFNGKCTNTEETIVLGCYISHDKIYVFDVVDERLDGVEQVTAAHEMLHAVYDRLSDSERNRIDALLLSYYDEFADERLRESIENYRERDPSVVPNELHSILGTEIRGLPAELELHYAKYFYDRSTVVTYSESYESEFTTREKQIAAIDNQLSVLSDKIDSQETQIALLGDALATELSQLESLRGEPEIFNNALPGYNQKVREYNQAIEQLKKDINRYNELAEERNAIAVEERGLIDAIDSRVNEL